MTITTRQISRRMLLLLVFCRGAAGFAPCALAEESYHTPRCEIIPLANHQVSFRIDGVEKTRWHFGPPYPRPFFFPLNGPAGGSLTRMGHPGAPNHDHHRSVWFAHQQVAGSDFWSEDGKTQIRQKSWLAYRDGDDEAVMAAQCGWFDGQQREVLEQQIVAAVIPLGAEHLLEFQVTLRPAPGASAVELGKTNFGLLAVRVAKSLSVHFGRGAITNSEGQQGEAEIFGKPARWMDYSGAVATGEGKSRSLKTAGITYFDHPANPRYPTSWHVREDGWMGAAFCLQDGYSISTDQPLVLRYLLHAHAGEYDPKQASATHAAFATRPGFVVSKSTAKHQQFEVARGAVQQP